MKMEQKTKSKMQYRKIYLGPKKKKKKNFCSLYPQVQKVFNILAKHKIVIFFYLYLY